MRRVSATGYRSCSSSAADRSRSSWRDRATRTTRHRFRRTASTSSRIGSGERVGNLVHHRRARRRASPTFRSARPAAARPSDSRAGFRCERRHRLDPIFAERAQTLGRGGAGGLSRTGFRFATLRGVDMRNIGLTFTHQNVDFEGCDAQFGGDCSLYGVPVLENDVMAFRLSMDLDVRVTSIYLTYGADRPPRFRTGGPDRPGGLHWRELRRDPPFGGTSAAHYFSGTTTNPVLSAHRQSMGSASGLGDVALRAKLNLRETPRASFAFLIDGRFPTGSRQDLLGSGKFAGRALAILNSRFNDFSPHVNVGYLYHAGTQQNDAVLGTVGFDHRMAESRHTRGGSRDSSCRLATASCTCPARSPTNRHSAGH